MSGQLFSVGLILALVVVFTLLALVDYGLIP